MFIYYLLGIHIEIKCHMNDGTNENGLLDLDDFLLCSLLSEGLSEGKCLENPPENWLKTKSRYVFLWDLLKVGPGNVYLLS